MAPHSQLHKQRIAAGMRAYHARCKAGGAMRGRRGRSKRAPKKKMKVKKGGFGNKKKKKKAKGAFSLMGAKGKRLSK